MEDALFFRFLSRHGLRQVDHLGDGKDGVVIQTDRPSAAKRFYSPGVYRRELRMYRILSGRGIDHIDRFAIPRLISFEDEILVIEMTIVAAPFILDFASSYDELELHHLGFTEEVWAEREQLWSDIFGRHWPSVRAARDELARLTDLTILDLTPNNIRL